MANYFLYPICVYSGILGGRPPSPNRPRSLGGGQEDHLRQLRGKQQHPELDKEFQRSQALIQQQLWLEQVQRDRDAIYYEEEERRKKRRKKRRGQSQGGSQMGYHSGARLPVLPVEQEPQYYYRHWRYEPEAEEEEEDRTIVTEFLWNITKAFFDLSWCQGCLWVTKLNMMSVVLNLCMVYSWWLFPDRPLRCFKNLGYTFG